MIRTVLDSIALGYQPVWNRARQLAAVRMPMCTLQPDGVDARHLMQVLGDDWPTGAPTLILAPDTPQLLMQALACEPVPNTWIEVPAAPFKTTEGLAWLTLAARRGHQLLRHAALADLRGEIVAPVDVRSLLGFTASEALTALASRQVDGGPPPTVRSPLVPGQLYEGVASRALAEHCLDEAGAWGVLGWPEDDVLHAYRHKPPACDASVIAQVLDALERDGSLDQLERLVRQDPVLAFRLLQYVNSAVFSLRNDIESLRHALMMLGFGKLSQWLTEQRVGAESDPALHPVRYTMVMHARMAQHLLDPGADDTLRAEVYLAAMLSRMDRLMNRHLPELLGKLPLPGRVYDALLRETGPYNAYLDLASAQADPAALARLPAICEQHDMDLESANRALIRMLATSRDQRSATRPLQTH